MNYLPIALIAVAGLLIGGGISLRQQKFQVIAWLICWLAAALALVGAYLNYTA